MEHGLVIKYARILSIEMLAHKDLIVGNELSQRWSRFLRQAVKVDSTMQGMIHDEDAETLFSGVQGQGCA